MRVIDCWVIVPLGRRKMIGNVVTNFMRQNYPHKHIIIAENGDAIGACKEYGFIPSAVIQTEKHQSIAKNAALDLLDSLGGGYWTVFDDDDYYGPEYIVEAMADKDKGIVWGKNRHFIWENGRLGLFNADVANGPVSYIQGSFMSSHTDYGLRFPILETGEDDEVCRIVRRERGIVYNCSIFHGIYNRHNNNTWKAKRVFDISGPGHDLGTEIDYDLVNGIYPDWQMRVMGHPPVATRGTYLQPIHHLERQ